MANSSAVSILDSNSSVKTVSTIDAMFSVAGTPSSVNVLTVQPSTANFSVVISSGTIASISSGSVTITSISSGSNTIGQVLIASSSPVFTAAGTPSTLPLTVQISTANTSGIAGALDIFIKGGGNANGQAPMANSAPVVLSSNQTVPNTLIAQTNGTTSTRVVSAATTNSNNLKASAGALIQIDLFNLAAYDIYVKFYNTSSAPTIGTATPFWTLPIKSGTGFSREFSYGKWFTTGVSYGITKGSSDGDATPVAAGDVTGTVDVV